MDDWSTVPSRNAVSEPAPQPQTPITSRPLDTNRPFMDDRPRLIKEKAQARPTETPRAVPGDSESVAGTSAGQCRPRSDASPALGGLGCRDHASESCVAACAVDACAHD